MASVEGFMLGFQREEKATVNTASVTILHLRGVTND